MKLDPWEVPEDLRVAAIELNDARDDLTDVIKRLRDRFRQEGILPGWVPMGEGEALAWNGRDFILTRGNPVLSASIQKRMEASDLIPSLYEECKRTSLGKP